MPEHTNSVEHQQYVLRGSARVGIGDEVFDVGVGTVVHIPAGIPHWYRVVSSEPFEFLCMVPAEKDEIQILGDGIPQD
jgi:quercetin dioxygenase-like cupin family protein